MRFYWFAEIFVEHSPGARSLHITVLVREGHRSWLRRSISWWVPGRSHTWVAIVLAGLYVSHIGESWHHLIVIIRVLKSIWWSEIRFQWDKHTILRGSNFMALPSGLLTLRWGILSLVSISIRDSASSLLIVFFLLFLIGEDFEKFSSLMPEVSGFHPTVPLSFWSLSAS